MKYALTETLDDNTKWLELLTDKLSNAEFVEFNVLYRQNRFNPEIEELEGELINEGKRKDKVYPSGSYRRYRLTEKVKKFILAKEYQSWLNYQIEDLSLIKDGKEILATITHENYIFILATEEERLQWNTRGFDFGELFELQKK
jgi:hypothetical protein